MQNITINEFNNKTRSEKIEFRRNLKQLDKKYCIGNKCNGKILSADLFPITNNYYCKECYKVYIKKSVDKNGLASRREKNRLKIGKKCVECLCADIELLEFDHIDTDKKEMTIAQSNSAKKIIKEAEKTRLLCVWCHRLRTHKDIEENIKMSKEDYEYTIEENAEVIKVGESKKCNGELCKGIVRNYDKFYYSKRMYSSYCIKCTSYNKSIIRNDVAKFVDNKKLEISECNNCKREVTKDTICCFDFDHLDQSTKLNTIANLRKQGNVDKSKIKEEIAKCQLLCCSCHKKKTVKQLGYHDMTQELSKYDHIQIKEKQPPSKCPKCNKNEKVKNADMCDNCYRIGMRKIQRPIFEDLETEIAENGFAQVGKKYGVRDNTIRKWIIWYVKKEGKQVTKINIKV